MTYSQFHKDDNARYSKEESRLVLLVALSFCQYGANYNRHIAELVNRFCDRVQGLNATLKNDKVLNHSLVRIEARLSVLKPVKPCSDQTKIDYVNRCIDLV